MAEITDIINSLIESEECELLFIAVQYKLYDGLIFCINCQKQKFLRFENLLKNIHTCSCNYNVLLTIRGLRCENCLKPLNITIKKKMLAKVKKKNMKKKVIFLTRILNFVSTLDFQIQNKKIFVHRTFFFF